MGPGQMIRKRGRAGIVESLIKKKGVVQRGGELRGGHSELGEKAEGEEGGKNND